CASENCQSSLTVHHCRKRAETLQNISTSIPKRTHEVLCGDFAEYFDVDSEKDFMSAVERVVFREEYRQERERDIVARFKPRTWADISNQIVGQLRAWHGA